MKAHFELKNILHRINGKDSKAYESMKGEYLFNDYTLYVDHIEIYHSGCLSNMRVKMAQSVALFPSNTYSNRSREIALRDLITRRFCDLIQISEMSKFILIDPPGQEILERTTAFVDQSFIEIRFTINLPSLDKLVEGNVAEDIFFNKLPQIINNSIIFENLEKEALYNHIETSEDADFLRNELENLRLIAFVAENSILPRQLGNNSLPIENKAIPFISPDTLKMDVELPNKGQITGMGLLRGITLIVGEDAGGKSTLLKAIEQGIYNHIPGDGREYVVSNPNSVKIRTDNGRSIHNIDISPFINNLPSDQNVNSFSIDKADSVVSQVANIIEAVEVGADVLLIDEDTSDNNLLYYDDNKEEYASEDIIPFIDKAKSLYNEYMVSSILAIEQAENHFGIADFVIQMSEFKALDITEKAKGIAQQNNDPNKINSHFGIIRERIPLLEDLAFSKKKENIDTPINEISCIEFGPDIIDLNSIEQIITVSQIDAIRDAIKYSMRYMDGKKSFRQVTSLVMLDIGRSGLDILSPRLSGDYAEFRKIEFAALINRLSTLKVKQRN